MNVQIIRERESRERERVEKEGRRERGKDREREGVREKENHQKRDLFNVIRLYIVQYYRLFVNIFCFIP